MKITYAQLKQVINEVYDLPNPESIRSEIENSTTWGPSMLKMKRDATQDILRKYQRGGPAWTKIVKLFEKLGKDISLLNKRHVRFRQLLQDIPLGEYSANSTSGDSNHILARLSGENQLITNSSLGKLVWGRLPNEMKGRDIDWKPGMALQLNKKLNWKSDELWRASIERELGVNPGQKTRRSSINHEMEHIVVSAIVLLTNVNISKYHVAGAGKSVATVKGEQSGWAGWAGEERTEFQLLGDRLIRDGYGTPEAPFTKDSILALAIYAHLDKAVRKDRGGPYYGKRIYQIPMKNPESVASLNEATDYFSEQNPLNYYWNKVIVGPSENSEYDVGFNLATLRANPKVRELLNKWLESRSSSIPIASQMLPGIASKLKSKSYIETNIDEILSTQSGINALALIGTDNEKKQYFAEGNKMKITHNQLRDLILEVINEESNLIDRKIEVSGGNLLVDGDKKFSIKANAGWKTANKFVDVVLKSIEKTDAGLQVKGTVLGKVTVDDVVNNEKLNDINVGINSKKDNFNIQGKRALFKFIRLKI